MKPDWYERRHELEPGQVFTMFDGSIVRLDRRVPGDGTAWIVDDWDEHHKNWACYEARIEPGDLVERLSDNYPNP